MHHAEPPIDVQLRGCIPVDFGISGAAVEEIRPGGVIVVHKAGDGKVRERDETEYFLCNRIDTGRGITLFVNSVLPLPSGFPVNGSKIRLGEAVRSPLRL